MTDSRLLAAIFAKAMEARAHLQNENEHAAKAALDSLVQIMDTALEEGEEKCG